VAHALALADRGRQEVAGGFKLSEGFAEVDNVDAIAGIEDERLHLGIPPFGLVSEVDASIQQFLHANTDHRFPLLKDRSESAVRPSRGTRD
jgi:hypothetical protein